MKKSILFLLAFTGLLAGMAILSSCHTKPSEYNVDFRLVDPDATAETKALFYNLLKYQDEAIMFGHQDDLAYGIGWWDDDFRSDVHDVCGKFPAVFGWDAGEIGLDRNIDSVSFTRIRDWMIRAFEKGGVNTLSWHFDNPVTGGDTWDVTPAVYAILPEGDKHEQYKLLLDELASFLQGLKTEEGIPVPVIFRPFHEHTGSWFWWGRGNCSKEEYISLFRFTVEYLRDEKGLHHLLYAYSPDRFASEEEYMDRFPGEDYVDLLGYDDYHSFTTPEGIPGGISSLGIVVRLGEKLNKPVALTETGLESIPVSNWWTDHVLNPVKSDSLARKISYMLVWRNANTKHHYAPYPGHFSAENFMLYEQDPFTWFLEDLPDMYTLED
jgi:mannan endo-1,4-beta-mannosidase